MSALSPPPRPSADDAQIKHVQVALREKQRRVVLLLAICGFAFHIVQATHFFWRGERSMGWASALSLVFYAAGMALAQRGQIGTAIAVMGFELLAYVSGAALYFGIDAGFYWYYLTTTVVASLIFRSGQRAVRWAWRLVFLGSGLVVTAWSMWRGRGQADLITEVHALNVITNVSVLLIAASYFAWASERAEASAEAERFRADQLLSSMLPAAITKRLKGGERTIADRADEVTVIFSDIVGFTPLTNSVSTEELITILNDIFSRFDRIAQECGVEKIKTIGDAYMAVAGIPEPARDHAARAAHMALRMRDAMKAYRAASNHAVDVRIGLHSGSVIAGVIGEQKPAYDLWGDAVNTASRMESHGEAGRVQISAACADGLPQDTFVVTPRGEIDVKGKGRMTTFWLEGTA